MSRSPGVFRLSSDAFGVELQEGLPSPAELPVPLESLCCLAVNHSCHRFLHAASVLLFWTCASTSVCSASTEDKWTGQFSGGQGPAYSFHVRQTRFCSSALLDLHWLVKGSRSRLCLCRGILPVTMLYSLLSACCWFCIEGCVYRYVYWEYRV